MKCITRNQRRPGVLRRHLFCLVAPAPEHSAGPGEPFLRMEGWLLSAHGDTFPKKNDLPLSPPQGSTGSEKSILNPAISCKVLAVEPLRF